MNIGLFDLEARLDRLTDNGDILPTLDALVPWESFREALEVIYAHERKSNAGRKPFDVVLMFKILILQALYNLSDDEMEFQIMDRLSFMRFLGLSIGDRVPDAKTIWLFRSKLEQFGLARELFERFNGFLAEAGFAARKGQIVDATIVHVPVQRNTPEENAAIKAGEPPVEKWSKAKRRQKDVDARWTQKRGVNHFGYKNHVEVDVGNKIIRDYRVTDASVHDSNVFEEILDEGNASKDVYADSAYRSVEHETALADMGFRPHLQRKGHRGHPLTDLEKRGNRTRSRKRSRIEHVFGAMWQKTGGFLLRTIGIKMAEVKIGLCNLAYNMDRYRILQMQAIKRMMEGIV